MPNENTIWQHYHKSQHFYQNDHTHRAAYCRHCVNHEVDKIVAHEFAEAQASGWTTGQVREREEVERDGE